MNKRQKKKNRIEKKLIPITVDGEKNLAYVEHKPSTGKIIKALILQDFRPSSVGRGLTTAYRYQMQEPNNDEPSIISSIRQFFLEGQSEGK